MSAFAFDSCYVVYNGRLITGFGEGTTVTINVESEEWNNRKMADGHVVSSKMLDESAKTEIVLRWNSPSNSILEAERSLRTTGMLFVRLPDGTELTGPRTRVNKRPSPTYGQDPSDVTWEFFSEKMKMSWSIGEF